MAAMLTTRKALPSTFLHKFISPVRSLAAPTAVQSFTTNVQRHDLERDRSIDIDCRGRPALPFKLMDDTPSFFTGNCNVNLHSCENHAESFETECFDLVLCVSDLFDLFIPANLTHMMNMMEQMENLSAMERGMGGGERRAWDVKEDDDSLYLRIDLPGLGKEDVKVSVEGNTLIIKGEGEKESESDECGRKYSSRIDLPPKLYKLDQIKAETKNGVLRIAVPKVKEEERKDIFQVQIGVILVNEEQRKLVVFLFVLVLLFLISFSDCCCFQFFSQKSYVLCSVCK